MNTRQKSLLRVGLVVVVATAPLLVFADDGTFVSLSGIPVFQKFTSSSTLPAFLNNLYYVCIGIATVLSVLQLVRGGITYMLVDTVTSKEEARHLISTSILGLLLVLSPYIVFNIINPKILTLDVNTTEIQPDLGVGTGTQPPGGTTPPGTPPPGTQPPATPGAPGTPTGLHEESSTDTSATIAWTAPSDASNVAKYNIYQDGALKGSVTDTRALIQPLSKDKSVIFTVTSVSASNKESAASNPVTITPPPTPPSGYYIISGWQWADNGYILAGDTKTPRESCWKYFGGTNSGLPYWEKTPDITPASPSAPVDTKSDCQQRLTSRKQTEAQRVSQYPGYKAESYESQCSFVPIAEANIEIIGGQPPGTQCN